MKYVEESTWQGAGEMEVDIKSVMEGFGASSCDIVGVGNVGMPWHLLVGIAGGRVLQQWQVLYTT